jgi:hypothetical protein
MPNQFGQINVAIRFGKSTLVWQILFTSAIQFGTSVWQLSLVVLFGNSSRQFILSLAIHIGNSVWQFCVAIQFGNAIQQLSLGNSVSAIQFEFGNSVWLFSLSLEFQFRHFGNSVFGNSVWYFSLAIEFGN